MKEIAVILINYNTSTYTLQCTEKVFEKTNSKISIEVIVVDNNSDKKDYINLCKNLKDIENVKLIKSEVNTGFGGGNNLGFSNSNSKYVLFLNNDAFLMNNCIEICRDLLEKNIHMGLLGAQNYDQHNKPARSFDHNKGFRKMIFGRSFLTWMNALEYPDVKKEYFDPIAVNWISGAFMFMRSEDFRKIGCFDSNIFLYFEEMDLAFRLKKLCKETFLVPNAKIIHIQGQSTSRNKRLSEEGLISFLHVVRKNYGFLKNLLFRFYFIITITIKPKKWCYYKILFSVNPKKYSLRP